MSLPAEKKFNAISTIGASQARHVRNQYPRGLRLVMILLSLAMGTCLVAIGFVIISVAIPKISTEFKTLADVGWYGSAYLLTITALQPAAGSLYKLFNVKFVYLASIVIFEGLEITCIATRLVGKLANRLFAFQLAQSCVLPPQTQSFSSSVGLSPALEPQALFKAASASSHTLPLWRRDRSILG